MTLKEDLIKLTDDRNEWKTRCEFSLQQLDKLTAERDELQEIITTMCDALSIEAGDSGKKIADLVKERDAYAKCADDMAAAHKVERDGLFALHTEQINYTVKIAAERDALELRIGAMIVERSDAFFKVIQERDALKDAARLALDALERSHADAYLDQPAIAALKAVL